MLEAVANPLFDLALCEQRALHSGVEPDRPSDPTAPRMIERDVGSTEKIRDPCFGRGSRGNSREGAGLDDSVVEREGSGDRTKQRFRHLLDFRQPVGAELERSRKLVPAQARGDRSGTEHFGCRCGDALQ